MGSKLATHCMLPALELAINVSCVFVWTRELALRDVMVRLHLCAAEEVRSKLDEIHRVDEHQRTCQCDGGCVPAAVAVVNRLKLLPSVTAS